MILHLGHELHVLSAREGKRVSGGELHSSRSPLRIGVSDSAVVWGADIPDYSQGMNKEEHLTPGHLGPPSRELPRPYPSL